MSPATRVDDLVVKLTGLVLARELLSRRGTAVDELDLGIARAHEKLAHVLHPAV